MIACGCVQEGVGRRVGEQAEQYWAKTKPLALLARYMTHAHWWDSFNALAALLVYLQQRSQPILLRKKLEAIPGTIGTRAQVRQRLHRSLASLNCAYRLAPVDLPPAEECRVDIQKLKAQAIAAGVDLNAAMERLEDMNAASVLDVTFRIRDVIPEVALYRDKVLIGLQKDQPIIFLA